MLQALRQPSYRRPLGLFLPALAMLLTLAMVPGARAAGPPQGAAPLETVKRLDLPPIANAELLAEDEALAGPGIPVRFALPVEVAINPGKAGNWESLADGRELWRLRVRSPGAVSLNFGFAHYTMPEGGSLSLYRPDGKQAIRPFTAADNEEHGQLWTPILPGDEAVLQVLLPVGARRYLDLELVHVGHGYRPFGPGRGSDKVGQESGACNVDVICPEGDDWREEIRSVAVIGTGGSTFCTGFLVNNTAQDLTPYFMTADHCGISAGNAASLVVYWNYENSTCRPPGSGASGGPGDGTLDQFQTGSIFRADYGPSDFTLVELDDDPDPAWNVHWAGWDATPGDFAGAIAIHHPSTDEKRISFENDPTSTTSYLGNTAPGDGTHVRVLDWDLGTTEGGSSGSPLFNPDHRVVGQLHGGFAACGNDDADWYGRISVSWNGGGTAATRLIDWLDPTASGVLTLDGRDMVEGPDFGLAIDPMTLAQCAGSDAIFTVDVSSLEGFTDPVTLSLVGEPAGTTVGFSPNPVMAPGSSTLTIGNTGAATPGSSTLTVTGVSGMLSHMVGATLDLFVGLPGTPTLTTPADGATNQGTRPAFTWQSLANVATYTIEIATDPAFANVVDSAMVTDAEYTPTTDLQTNTAYYWRVQASNGCGDGAVSATFDFTTAPAPGDCPPGVPPTQVFFDDLEAGAVGWTHSGAGDTWALSSTRTHSGTNAYHAEDVASVTDQYLESPAIDLPADAVPLTLQFWNHQTLEDGGSGCFDGSVLELSANGGTTWARLEAELLTDPYDGPIDNGFSNPLANENAWCGDPQDWLESIVDLDAFAGQTVQFRFRLATDSSVGREGWYIDDVTVQSCENAGLFADGFESGDTSSWSSTMP